MEDNNAYAARRALAPDQPTEVHMTAEKELTSVSAQNSLDEERKLRSERISQAIRELPDYKEIDDTGFFRDLWDAFKDDTKRIWRDRKVPTSSGPKL
jgi:hypothetical protein